MFSVVKALITALFDLKKNDELVKNVMEYGFMRVLEIILDSFKDIQIGDYVEAARIWKATLCKHQISEMCQLYTFKQGIE